MEVPTGKATSTARRTRWMVVAAVALAALLLRAWAVWQLPVDFDEPVYLQAAGDYATLLRAGDLAGVIQYSGNSEHPPLIKLLYSLPLLALSPRAAPVWGLYLARAISAAFGALAALLLAAANPLAGAFLAVDTLAVKYTSQAYLEALPMLTSLGAVLALAGVRPGRARRIWLSAALLGVTAAAKYAYFPVVFPILYLAIWEKRLSWRQIGAYTLLAGLAFWLLDPYLWSDPLQRLEASLLYHAGYAQGAHVQEVAYPWYQPLVWISRSVPWHPEVFFYPGLDGLVFLLGLGGMYWEWKARRWTVIWFVAGLIVLLLWPTKWPQYALLLVAPLCLSASALIGRGVRFLREQETYWNWIETMAIRPPRWLWITLLGFFLLLVAGKVGFEINLAVLRTGWSRITAEQTPLPADTVYALQPLPDGGMLAGTEDGLLIWQPAVGSQAEDTWQVFRDANAPQAYNRVLAIALSLTDNVGWFGTDAGLVRSRGDQLDRVGAAEIGLEKDEVRGLACSPDGRLWVATTTGLAAFDGQRWTTYTHANSGLASDTLLSLAIQPKVGGYWVWVGMVRGADRFDFVAGEWTHFDASNSPLGVGGVAGLMVDGQGRVWAATLGGGLARWDGRAWQAFTTGNSGLPSNDVQRIIEAPGGTYWIGTALPTQNGGSLVRFVEGGGWKTFTPLNSGYTGAEPLAIALAADGRLWVGTRAQGIIIYEPQ